MIVWTYHRRTGGDVVDVPGGGHAVEQATATDGQDYARTRQRRPIGGRAGRANEWDYVCAGTDAQLLDLFADDAAHLIMLAGFGVA